MTGKERHQESEAPFSGDVIRVEHIPAKGVEGRIEADADQRAAIAAALDLLRLDTLSFSYKLRSAGKGRVRLTGRITAAYEQSCVVTLEPVEAGWSEDVVQEFWPPEDLVRHEKEGEGEGIDVDLEGPEPIENGVIDPGRLAYEILASEMDPYPRKPGAALEWREGEGAETAREDSPFAVLESLKPTKK